MIDGEQLTDQAWNVIDVRDLAEWAALPHRRFTHLCFAMQCVCAFRSHNHVCRFTGDTGENGKTVAVEFAPAIVNIAASWCGRRSQRLMAESPSVPNGARYQLAAPGPPGAQPGVLTVLRKAVSPYCPCRS